MTIVGGRKPLSPHRSIDASGWKHNGLRMQPVIRVEHLYISPGHNFFGHHGMSAGTNESIECDEIRCLAGRGIEGDRFLDFKPNYKGQITFFAREIYDELCARFDVWDRPPSAFRRNVITSGVDLNSFIGKEFEIQGVRFLGMAECSPCEWQDQAFAPGTEEALQGRGGLRAKILTDGVLRVDRHRDTESTEEVG